MYMHHAWARNGGEWGNRVETHGSHSNAGKRQREQPPFYNTFCPGATPCLYSLDILRCFCDDCFLSKWWCFGFEIIKIAAIKQISRRRKWVTLTRPYRRKIPILSWKMNIPRNGQGIASKSVKILFSPSQEDGKGKKAIFVAGPKACAVRTRRARARLNRPCTRTRWPRWPPFDPEWFWAAVAISKSCWTTSTPASACWSGADTSAKWPRWARWRKIQWLSLP